MVDELYAIRRIQQEVDTGNLIFKMCNKKGIGNLTFKI